MRASLRFHHHAPQQAAVLLAFHQQATNQVGGDQFGRAGEKRWEEGWEVLGDGLGGYGSGLVKSKQIAAPSTILGLKPLGS
jgi:hypothetical protein